MSTHPNVILLCELTPDNLSRKTMRNILEEAGVKDEYGKVKIGPDEYNYEVMEEDYDESWQISAKIGNLIFFDLVTYGYGDNIAWDELQRQKNDLETWAQGICERHNCSAYQIYVTANYW